MASNSTTGGLYSQAILMLMASFTAIAWYNCIELNVMIWMKFKRYKGLYFYSLLVSSWGIVFHALGFLTDFFQIWKNKYVSVTIIIIGWYAMVTGQSFVLYSRLHLVMYNPRKIKWVLYMIIVDFFLFHVPTTVLVFGANSPQQNRFAFPYSVMEKIQLTAFCIQESIISGLYVYYTWKLLKPGGTFQKKHVRRVMRHLILINVLIIVMDLTLLGTEFANHYEIETTYKSALYSIKLKLEFAVLNQLVTIARGASISADDSNDYGYQISSPTAEQRIEMFSPVQVGSSRCYSGSTKRPSIIPGSDPGGILKTIDADVTVSDCFSRKGKERDGVSLDSKRSDCVGGPISQPMVPRYDRAKDPEKNLSPSLAESQVEPAVGHGWSRAYAIR